MLLQLQKRVLSSSMLAPSPVPSNRYDELVGHQPSSCLSHGLSAGCQPFSAFFLGLVTVSFLMIDARGPFPGRCQSCTSHRASGRVEAAWRELSPLESFWS
ncbi:hypothetical protein AWENTII_013007 [Aspergillus wentii]